MRNIFISLTLFTLLCVAATSCKKCYTCVYYQSSNYIYCEKNTPKAELASLDSSCIQTGGIWSVYDK